MDNNVVSTAQATIGLKNDHNVYILGAGFSREAGLPLINDFLVQMRDSHEWLVSQGRTDEAKAVEKVLRFRLKSASAAYYVSLDLENIEELFSLASASEGDMDIAIRIAIAATVDFVRKTKPFEQCNMFVANSTRSPSLFLPAAANNVAAKYPGWAKPAGPLDTLNPGRVGPFRISRYAFHVARLLGLFLNGVPKGENTFITFNYDTVLEDALSDLSIEYRYAFGPTEESSPASPSEQSPIPVLKLHGSVNWGRSRPFRSKWPLKTYASPQEMLTAKAEPTLVPPTWKKFFQGPLEGIWESAVHKLTTATRIVIIGFSIPPTDIHFKYLLAAGLQNNVSLRQILFVNPDEKKELEPRARSLLRESYIDSGMIDFARMRLGEFTGFHLPQVGNIGRPAEYGLNCEFYSAYTNSSLRLHYS